MNDLRGDDRRSPGLHEPFPGEPRSALRPRWGRVKYDVDIIGLGEGMECGGEDFVLQPEPGKYEYRSILRC